MISKSTLALLLQHFDKTASLKWAAVGVVIGLFAWVWGESPVPATVLEFASGFGWMLVVPPILAIIFFFSAYFLKGRLSQLAYNDFQNMVYWAHPKLLRATSAFCGLALAAAVFWTMSGNINALKTTLLSIVLICSLFWIWATLLVSANAISKRCTSAKLSL